jgi:hypothetical protein
MLYPSTLFWLVVFHLYRFCGVGMQAGKLSCFQGMRRAISSNWGLWEFETHEGGLENRWWPSPDDLFPPPPFATSNQPLKVERFDFVVRKAV